MLKAKKDKRAAFGFLTRFGGACLLLWPALCAGDSIKLGGVTHDDVHITDAGDFYDVRFPQTGEKRKVYKTEVDADEVQIGDDEVARAVLRDQFRAKQREKRPDMEVKAIIQSARARAVKHTLDMETMDEIDAGAKPCATPKPVVIRHRDRRQVPRSTPQRSPEPPPKAAATATQAKRETSSPPTAVKQNNVPEPPRPAPKKNDPIRLDLEGRITNISREKKAVADKARRDSMGTFVDSRGVIILTNLPERYRLGGDEYAEVELALTPIEVPRRLRALSRSVRGRAPKKGTRRLAKPPKPKDVSNIRELATYYADHYKVDPYLVLAVIRQESNFAMDAKSTAGACGLMQLMPGTAADMNVDDIWDPAENIAGGTQYLAGMLDMFDHKPNPLDWALAAYNWGPGNVQKHGIPGPASTSDKARRNKETPSYISRVKGFYRRYGGGETPGPYVGKGVQLASATVDTAEQKAPLIIHLKNGQTQPADEIGQSAENYFVRRGIRITQIRKDLVERIEDRTSG